MRIRLRETAVPRNEDALTIEAAFANGDTNVIFCGNDRESHRAKNSMAAGQIGSVQLVVVWYWFIVPQGTRRSSRATADDSRACVTF